MDKFRWFGQHGFYPAEPDGVYDAGYFQKYEAYAATKLGVRLNRARLSLVQKWTPMVQSLVDVGIGCGHFVEERSMGVSTFGYDVNPKGVEWLQARGRYLDPYKTNVVAMTFWDSLEHIEQPEVLLDRCLEWVFVSIPIFTDREHVLRSKHFRTDEHYHYFTREGLVEWMRCQGFALRDHNDVESRLGREDIQSFVFQRVQAP